MESESEEESESESEEERDEDEMAAGLLIRFVCFFFTLIYIQFYPQTRSVYCFSNIMNRRLL